MIYNALIGSKFRYGVRAWGSSSCHLRNSLQTAQNKLLRAILFLSFTSNVHHVFSELKLLKVENIYEHEISKLFHSVVHNYCPSAFLDFFEHAPHGYATRLRQNCCFSLSKPKTEFGKKSLKFSGVKIWTKVPLSIKEIPDSKQYNKVSKTFFLSS